MQVVTLPLTSCRIRTSYNLRTFQPSSLEYQFLRGWVCLLPSHYIPKIYDHNCANYWMNMYAEAINGQISPSHILCAQPLQSCLTLLIPHGCSPPGSSVHGILQARILEWVALPSSRGVFLTQGSNLRLLHCKQILYPLSHPRNLLHIPYQGAKCYLCI